MKNIDEIDAVKSLARVAPGAQGGDPTGAGARALLAVITSEEPAAPVRTRGYAARRRALGLAASFALAAGVVVGPSLLEDGPGVPGSYAVTRTADGMVTIQVRDFHDALGLEKRLKELNVPAIVDHLPYGQVCRGPRGKHVEDIPQGLYSLPENIPGEKEGWQMQINTRLFRPGQTFVWTISSTPGGHGSSTSTYLMEGPVAPCEPVPAPKPKVYTPEFRTATVEGRSLEGMRVDEKTVGEVLPELRRRGKKVVFLIMAIPPGNPGGFGEERTQEEPVGDDWSVWEAEENAKGVIRLLVTEERYDRNPVYGGPRDAVISE
ncbi:hypothetical protein HS041_21815 [Planomonospora sp. ID67723]|uniref:hypothetical protein n=1 Tax=Planomonospora sp. ID67723 TaxID=2738134 RepID=UPI0018C3DB7D|nr:hypothetical protein [Planomonospora sp. ID67723]MBG0830403.1 hypothetical protein [Planomonospora sp. ID67723]